MVSREHKKAALHEKLQLLRSITYSQAVNKSSIIIDTSKYIQELKQNIERLNEEIECERSYRIAEPTLPVVSVETLEKGFLINVYSEKSFPGLLMSILEVFEEFGLTVLEARASCTETFRLQAVGDNQIESLDTQVVKQAVLRAIKNCTDSSNQEE